MLADNKFIKAPRKLKTKTSLKIFIPDAAMNISFGVKTVKSVNRGERMRAFKMVGVNEEDIKRVRYCFAESYIEAKKRFTKEYWYIRIEEISECSPAEASINGVHN